MKKLKKLDEKEHNFLLSTNLAIFKVMQLFQEFQNHLKMCHLDCEHNIILGENQY